jgi:hypothetical protein
MKHACGGPSPEAAHVDVRALIDTAILARWLEDEPEFRMTMWLAEDSRQRLQAARDIAVFQRRRGVPEAPAFSPSETADMETEVAAVRKRAKEVGMPIRKNGSVLPNVEQMAQSVDDLWELYNMLYRPLSSSTHAGGRSFVRDEVVRRDGRTYLKRRPPFDELELRSIAVPAVCVLFATVSRQVGLGIDVECGEILMSVISAE